MRKLTLGLVTMLAICWGTAAAQAASVTLVPTLPTTANIGERANFNLVLDAPSGLIAFGVAVLFDPTVLRYEPGLSDATDYILYTGGKGATYLVPESDPWAVWTGFKPPGLEQVNIVFIEHALLPNAASGTGILLGNIAFTFIGVGTTNVGLDFVNVGGTAFNVNGVELEDTVAVNSIEVGVIPEPTTALLVGLGLAGVGASRRWARTRRSR